MYDGLATSQGQGVSVRAFASPQHDVIAIEVDDRRPQPGPVYIDLRMLRYALQYQAGRNWELTASHAMVVRHNSHTAESRLDIRSGRILLSQRFREDNHFSSSAVAIAVAGRNARARYADETTVRLTVAPGPGRFTILIASAAALVPDEIAASVALRALDAAQPMGFEGLLAAARA